MTLPIIDFGAAIVRATGGTFDGAMVNGLLPRGTYNSLTADYVLDNLVTYLGSTWRALGSLAAGTTPVEGASWTIWAAKGADGTGFIPRGEWDGETTYQANDLVTYNGELWQVLQTISGVTPTENADWHLTVAKGVNPRGEWDIGLTYNKNDLVGHDGSTWQALDTSTGVTPTEGVDWHVFAAAGVAGADGADGAVGPVGITPREDWVSGTSYVYRDVVFSRATEFFCILATSGTTIPFDDPTHWSVFMPGLNFLGDWVTATDYYPGDAVRSSGGLWFCMADSNSNEPSVTPAEWGEAIADGATGPAGAGLEAPAAIPYLANTALSMSFGGTQKMTLSGPLTLTTIPENRVYRSDFVFEADGDGPYNISFPGDWVFPAGSVVANPYSLAANTKALLTLIPSVNNGDESGVMAEFNAASQVPTILGTVNWTQNVSPGGTSGALYVPGVLVSAVTFDPGNGTFEVDDIHDGIWGTELTIYTPNSGVTFKHQNNINLVGGVDYTMGAGDILCLKRFIGETIYRELYRRIG